MSTRNTSRTGRKAAYSKMRHGGAGARAVAYANRLGFVHGMTGQTALDERDIFAHLLGRLAMPPRQPNAHNLQVAGEAYAIGRLVGAEMARDYADMTPERRARLADTLWPASTILPRSMEPRLTATIQSFKRQPDAPDAPDDADLAPVDGTGPVPRWW